MAINIQNPYEGYSVEGYCQKNQDAILQFLERALHSSTISLELCRAVLQFFVKSDAAKAARTIDRWLEEEFAIRQDFYGELAAVREKLEQDERLDDDKRKISEKIQLSVNRVLHCDATMSPGRAISFFQNESANGRENLLQAVRVDPKLVIDHWRVYAKKPYAQEIVKVAMQRDFEPFQTAFSQMREIPDMPEDVVRLFLEAAFEVKPGAVDDMLKNAAIRSIVEEISDRVAAQSLQVVLKADQVKAASEFVDAHILLDPERKHKKALELLRAPPYTREIMRDVAILDPKAAIDWLPQYFRESYAVDIVKMIMMQDQNIYFFSELREWLEAAKPIARADAPDFFRFALNMVFDEDADATFVLLDEFRQHADIAVQAVIREFFTKAYLEPEKEPSIPPFILEIEWAQCVFRHADLFTQKHLEKAAILDYKTAFKPESIDACYRRPDFREIYDSALRSYYAEGRWGFDRDKEYPFVVQTSAWHQLMDKKTEGSVRIQSISEYVYSGKQYPETWAAAVFRNADKHGREELKAAAFIDPWEAFKNAGKIAEMPHAFQFLCEVAKIWEAKDGADCSELLANAVMENAAKFSTEEVLAVARMSPMTLEKVFSYLTRHDLGNHTDTVFDSFYRQWGIAKFWNAFANDLEYGNKLSHTVFHEKWTKFFGKFYQQDPDALEEYIRSAIDSRPHFHFSANDFEHLYVILGNIEGFDKELFEKVAGAIPEY